MSDYSEPSAVFTSTYVDNHRIMISITTTKITEAPEAISYQNEIRYWINLRQIKLRIMCSREPECSYENVSVISISHAALSSL